jgi:photosystem II stability/assembly factor-like uncharacterized protein
LYSPSAVVHVRSLFRSDDLGATWQTTRVPGVKTLLDGAVLPDGRALVVTPSGRLVRSQTGTWRQWDDVAGWPGTHGQEEHLSVTADGTLFSARHRYLNGYGGIWVSTDGGSTWAPAAEPTRR